MAEQVDKFLGRWRVTEYVFEPSGQFVGQIQQIRELHQLADGNIRVTQHCEPDENLSDHPMSRFHGSWVFDLKPDGRVRRYLGPAVIGTGLVWQDGIMTGSGLWPEFAYNFHSYAILVTPERQLTGGQFYLPGQHVAQIIGVAEPENGDTNFPTLDLDAAWPDRPLYGKETRVSPDGQIESESTLRRKITTKDCKQIWDEQRDGQETKPYRFSKSPHKEYVARTKHDTLQGFAKRYGPARLIDLSDHIGQQQTLFELFDAKTNTIVGLHHHYKNQVLQSVRCVHLSTS